MNSISSMAFSDTTLCIKIKDGANNTHYLDFNRIRFVGVPLSREIESRKELRHANRDSLAHEFKKSCEQLLIEKSEATISNLFSKFLTYLKWCDFECIHPIDSQSAIAYCEYCYERYRKGEIKSGTYITTVSSLRNALVSLEDIGAKGAWVDSATIVSHNDTESHEAYSKSDLNKILPFLRAFFKQTSTQFILSPHKFIEASAKDYPMLFEWKGKSVLVYRAINKMMAAATFLLAYYTYSNTTQLYTIRRPKNSSYGREKWYVMPAFKRRAFKVIHIEVGEHHIDVPKYCIDFFDTLIEVSRLIDDSDEAPLIQMCSGNKRAPMNGAILRDFNGLFIRKHFPLKDDLGRELRLKVSRFRATGGKLSLLNGNELEASIQLNNTSAIVSRSYSVGNKHENQKMMQEASLIRAEQAKGLSNCDDARDNLGIKVLTYEQLTEEFMPKIELTAHGSYCSSPFGDKSKRFNRRVRSSDIGKEPLACADLLACFGCKHQVIVQSVEDIWCLLSFKECIEESLYSHLSRDHFDYNYEKVIDFIDNNILPRVSKRTRVDADKKLVEYGRHPLWIAADLLPRHSKI